MSLNKRQKKKLNKRAMDLLIDCGWCESGDFDLWGGDWIKYVHIETREESWVDEVEPFGYLKGLVQDTLLEYIEVNDDSKYGFHIEQVWKRDPNLSVIDVFSIFKSTYGLRLHDQHLTR